MAHAHHAAAGALAGVVQCAAEAALAEGVAAGRRHRLTQQLEAQDALGVIGIFSDAPLPACVGCNNVCVCN